MHLWKYDKKGKQDLSAFQSLLISRLLENRELAGEYFHVVLALYCEQS